MQDASTPDSESKQPLDRLPFTPPFFYGWVIVACAIVNQFLGSGTSNVVLSVLLKPIEDETGWTRTMIAASVSVGALGSGLLSPFAGRLADRFGGRVLMSAGGAICGSLYIAVAHATAFPLFILGHAANRAIASATMSGVVSQATVTKWFDARRPRVLGMVGTAGALGASAMGIAAQTLMVQIGWRGVMTINGLLTLALVVLPCAIFIRRRPEDVGLLPDGATTAERPPVQTQGRQLRRGTEYPWTLSQALHTRSYWLVICSSAMAMFGVTGISTNQIAYFTDQGIDPAVAASALVVYTFSSAIASLIWGFLTERFEERSISVLGFLLGAGCVAFLTTVDSGVKAYVFVAIFGLCARGQMTLVTIVFAQYYGRQHFGAIYGLAAMFQTLASAIGPVAAALTFDMTGSYLGAFRLLVGLFLVAAFVMFLAKKPTPPPALRNTLSSS